MTGKVILITGASSGIGLAAATLLAGQGHIVYGGARRVERMAPLVAAGGRTLALDVTDEATMSAAVETVIAAEGRIDVLVNNAGYGSYGAVEDVPLSEARNQIEVNIFGLARMTQLVLPHMRRQGSGLIVNVSSIGGTIWTPLGAWYHATKFAVEGFSNCLRMETAQFGIDVAIVAPGAIDTGFNQILEDKVNAVSGQGAYADLAKSISRAANTGGGSSPDVIAKAISRAVGAARPKPMYRAGKYGYSLPLMARILPRRWFDRLVLSMTR